MQRRGFLVLLATISCSKKAFNCLDVTGLTQEEIQTRTTLAYSDFSLDSKRACLVCQQWVAPKDDGCGACKLLKGPVHPNGTCKSFALKA